MRFDVFTGPIAPSFSDITTSGGAIGPGLRLFHDGGTDMSAHWRQTPDRRLVATIYQFDGTYVSLAAGTDDDFRTGIGRGRVVVARLDVDASRPVTTFMRLNVSTEEGQETLFETVVVDRGARTGRFDLDALHRSIDGLRDAWLDIIFADPAMLELTVRDLTLSLEAGNG